MPGITITPDLEVRPPRTRPETRHAHDLIRSAERAAPERWTPDYGMGYPGYDPAYTRAVYYRGDLAGAVRIYPETMRIGEARLKTAGIGPLCMLENFRGKGLAAPLMRDALALLAQHRFHAAVMFSRPGEDTTFGFTGCFGEHTIAVETRHAQAPPRTLRSYPFKHGDAPTIQRIHNENDKMVACSLLRNGGHVSKRRKEGALIRLLTDEPGRIKAYFFAEDCGDHLAVGEVGLSDPALAPGLLAECAAMAAECSAGMIRFNAPPNHPFARYLLRFPSTHAFATPEDEGGKLALIDLREAFECMVPEWDALVARSPLADGHAELTLVVDGAPYRIRAHRGAVDCSPGAGPAKWTLSKRSLARLITGYDYVEETIERSGVRLPAAARALAAALFPKRHPYIWPFDRY